MSFESDERQIRASLGLHRGRRALGFVLLALTGLAALLVVGRDEPPVLVPMPAVEVPSAPSSPPQANRAPVQRRSPGTQIGHRRGPVRAAAPVASPPERTAPPAAERAAEPPPEKAGRAPAVQLAERLAPPAELAQPPPAVPLAEPPAPPEAELGTPDEPAAEPLPEPAAPVATDDRGEAIARAIAAAKRAAVRNCFEHELKQTPKLTGTVVVELDLAAPDRVEALRVSDDLNRPEFTRCVTSAMQGVRFAALDEDLSVRVPYTLSPVQR